MSSVPKKSGEGGCTTPRQRLQLIKINAAIRNVVQMERLMEEERRQEEEELRQAILERKMEEEQKREEARRHWEAMTPEERDKRARMILADLEADRRRDPD